MWWYIWWRSGAIHSAVWKRAERNSIANRSASICHSVCDIPWGSDLWKPAQEQIAGRLCLVSFTQNMKPI
jgi:hypothetical protein